VSRRQNSNAGTGTARRIEQTIFCGVLALQNGSLPAEQRRHDRWRGSPFLTQENQMNAGKRTEALEDAKDRLRSATAEIEKIRIRKAEGSERLRVLEEERRDLMVAALDDAVASKKLKSKTSERDDAAQLLEGLTLAETRAADAIATATKDIEQATWRETRGKLLAHHSRTVQLRQELEAAKDALYAKYDELSAHCVEYRPLIFGIKSEYLKSMLMRMTDIGASALSASLRRKMPNGVARALELSTGYPAEPFKADEAAELQRLENILPVEAPIEDPTGEPSKWSPPRPPSVTYMDGRPVVGQIWDDNSCSLATAAQGPDFSRPAA
jgi:hypothetical protein